MCHPLPGMNSIKLTWWKKTKFYKLSSDFHFHAVAFLLFPTKKRANNNNNKPNGLSFHFHFSGLREAQVSVLYHLSSPFIGTSLHLSQFSTPKRFLFSPWW